MVSWTGIVAAILSHSCSDLPLQVTSIIMVRNVMPTVRKEDVSSHYYECAILSPIHVIQISRAMGASMSFVKDIRLIQKKDGRACNNSNS